MVRGLALFAGLFILAAATAVAQDGATLANACTSCHGVEGRSRTAIPAIAGMEAAAMGAAMAAFKSDQRGGTIMGRIAKGYSDDQIAQIAAYFSEVKP